MPIWIGCDDISSFITNAPLNSMGKEAVEAFLIYFAVEGKVSAFTQNQAKSAIQFVNTEP